MRFVKTKNHRRNDNRAIKYFLVIVLFVFKITVSFSQDSLEIHTFDNIRTIRNFHLHDDNRVSIFGLHSVDGNSATDAFCYGLLNEEYELIHSDYVWDNSSDNSLHTVYPTNDGEDFLVSSSGRSFFDNSSFDANIMSIDTTGSLSWANTYLPPGIQFSTIRRFVEIPGKEGYWGCGLLIQHGITTNHGDMFLINIDENGHLISGRVLGKEERSYERAPHMVVTADSGLVISGEYVPAISGTNHDLADILLFKLDKELNIEWSYKYDSGFRDKSFTDVSSYKRIDQLSNGDLILVTNVIKDDKSNLLVMKTNKEGQLIWSKRIAEANYNTSFSNPKTVIFGDSLIFYSTISSFVGTSGNTQMSGVILDTSGLVRYSFRNKKDDFSLVSYSPTIKNEFCFIGGSTNRYSASNKNEGLFMKFKYEYLFGKMDELVSCDIEWEQNVLNEHEDLPLTVEEFPMYVKEANFENPSSYVTNSFLSNSKSHCKQGEPKIRIQATRSWLCHEGDEVILSTSVSSNIEWKEKETGRVISTDDVIIVQPEKTTIYQLYVEGILIDEYVIFVSNPSLCFPLSVSGPSYACSKDELTFTSVGVGNSISWFFSKDGELDTLGIGRTQTITFEDEAVIIAINEYGTVSVWKILKSSDCDSTGVNILASEKYCRGDSVKISASGGDFFTWHDKPTNVEIARGSNEIEVYTNDISDGIYAINENGESDTLTIEYFSEDLCERGIVDASEEEFCRGDEIKITYHGPLHPMEEKRSWIEIKNENIVLERERCLVVEPLEKSTYIFFSGISNRGEAWIINESEKCPFVAIEEPENVVLCPGDSVFLDANGDDQGYCWILSGDTLSATKDFWYSPKKSGRVTVKGFQHYEDHIFVTLDNSKECHVVYDYLSPNGDKVNDFFKVSGIENYEKVEVTIYNQWNQVVYESKDYKNDWDGAGLPRASYYYSLNLNGQEIKGTLYLDYED